MAKQKASGSASVAVPAKTSTEKTSTPLVSVEHVKDLPDLFKSAFAQRASNFAPRGLFVDGFSSQAACERFRSSLEQGSMYEQAYLSIFPSDDKCLLVEIVGPSISQAKFQIIYDTWLEKLRNVASRVCPSEKLWLRVREIKQADFEKIDGIVAVVNLACVDVCRLISQYEIMPGLLDRCIVLRTSAPRVTVVVGLAISLVETICGQVAVSQAQTIVSTVDNMDVMSFDDEVASLLDSVQMSAEQYSSSTKFTIVDDEAPFDVMF